MNNSVSGHAVFQKKKTQCRCGGALDMSMNCRNFLDMAGMWAGATQVSSLSYGSEHSSVVTLASDPQCSLAKRHRIPWQERSMVECQALVRD